MITVVTPEKLKDTDFNVGTEVSVITKVSQQPNNLIELLDDRVFASREALKPVVLESGVDIVKRYVTLNNSVALPSEPYLAKERAIVEHRNGLNILHLDIMFKNDITNPKANNVVGYLPDEVPKFNTLTEYQILSDRVNGFIYVNSNSKTIIAKGNFPKNTRIVVNLFGFTK